MRKDYNLEKRKYVIGGFITLIVIIYVVRLFALQIGDDKYKESADSNAFLKRTIYPARGLMYDREGRLVVFNQPAYDVMIIPKDVGDFDTLSLCGALDITKEELIEKWKEMKNPKKKSGIFSLHSSEVTFPSFAKRLWQTAGKIKSFPRFLHPETHG